MWFKKLCGLVAVVIFIAVIIFIYFVLHNTETAYEYNTQQILEKTQKWGTLKFSEGKWQRGDPIIRGRMCYDLLKNHVSIGLSEADLILWLGHPDGHYVDDGVFCYQIGKEIFGDARRYALCFSMRYKDGINGNVDTIFIYDWTKSIISPPN